MENLLLLFEEMSVRHQALLLFENLNFKVKQGEHWALVGPAGSGKTALLETIAGNFWASAGNKHYPLLDQVVEEQQQHNPFFNRSHLIAQVDTRHHFRTLSNTTEFYYQQRFNAADVENVTTVISYLQAVKAWAPSRYWTLPWVLQRLHLEPLQDKRLIMLSNGETKRLLLAEALLKNPMLLLLDNPLAGLDLKAREDFNRLCTEIANSGISLIMSTSAQEIPDAITHIGLLEGGKLVEQFPKSSNVAAQASSGRSNRPAADRIKALFRVAEDHHYESIVDIKEAVVRYGDKLVLDRVNWRVLPGERWALLGHNGAGKSTLLSLINADNPQAYANSVRIFGRQRGVGESIWDIKRKIGWVSQELYQYFPGGDTCLQIAESGFYDSLGLLKNSNPDKAAIAMQWLHLLQIEAWAHQRFMAVSASVQRLCLLARALVKMPPLLILDEPCQGLDDRQQEHFKQLIEAVCANSNTTLIYVSHYQNELPATITHTLRLEAGRVVAL